MIPAFFLVSVALASGLSLSPPAAGVEPDGLPKPTREAPSAPALETPDRLTVGAGYPDIRLPTIDGLRSLSVSGFRDRKVLLIEFASWSAASRAAVPDWHAKTERRRRDGELVVLGVVQEQHRDRPLLFAQWQRIDWPILWDPFNLTGCSELPRVVAIDEHGVVRAVDPTWEQLESEFLDVEFSEPERLPQVHEHGVEALITRSIRGNDTVTDALSDLLWRGPDDEHVRLLGGVALAAPDVPETAFQLGVAFRLRYDSATPFAQDFGNALAAWGAASRSDPGQVVWRRRVRQYGPSAAGQLPCYAWVLEAQGELLARGSQPVPLQSPLTRAECVPARAQPAPEEVLVEPDPEGQVRLDEGLIDFGGAFVFGEAPVGEPAADDGSPSEATAIARLHLTFLARAEEDVRWRNDVTPMVAWIESIPKGWEIERRLLRFPMPDEAMTRERRQVDFDVRMPANAGPGEIRGYVLVNACIGPKGSAKYLRRPFRLRVGRDE